MLIYCELKILFSEIKWVLYHSHSIMRNAAHIGISRDFAVLSGRFWGSYSLILFILIINYLCKNRHFILN